MYMIGAAATGAFGFLYFRMIDTAALAVVFIAILALLIPHDMMYGPQAALIAESFKGQTRYSGAARLPARLRHRRRPAPLIAAWLMGHYGISAAIAAYILASAR
ncbi:MAG: hypothetical protein U1E30_05170 [Rhodoblastus sp.]